MPIIQVLAPNTNHLIHYKKQKQKQMPIQNESIEMKERCDKSHTCYQLRWKHR